MPNSAILNSSHTLADFLAFATLRLKAAGIDNPRLDARILVAYGLQLDQTHILAQSSQQLSSRTIEDLKKLIERRALHEPVARILGEREFWSLSFGLNEATLEPRPDSETLVEAALKYVKKREAPARILDLGTGSGCLLLSLLHELPNATGLGIDKEPRALEQARLNAEKLGLTARSLFRISDWFENVDESFDLILSNPPYIADRDIPALMPEVRDYDPYGALRGGSDGLDAYRALIPRLSHFLNPDGMAFLEVGAHQAPLVADMLQRGGFSGVSIHCDLAGIERCIAAAIDQTTLMF